jgi:16S rRNA processing protein RimM
MADAPMLVLGVIVAPHGVHGGMRVKTFCADPLELGAYGALSTRNGDRQFELKWVKPDKAGARIKIIGITNRDAAEALRGTELCVPRDRLPSLDDAEEFYHADLVGLKALTPDGDYLGRVLAVHDFGAGDLLEIGDRFVPFTRAIVPEIDLANGRLTVLLPPETEARAETDASDDKEATTP